VSRAVIVSSLLLLAGCEDPLKVAQLLEEPRILGVRLAGPDDRATLEPGQTAQLEVLLAGPTGRVGARLAYQLCEAADSERGVPYCAAEPFAEATVDFDGAALAIDVPVELAAGARLAVLGIACLEGEPSLAADPLDWSCSGSDPGLRFSFDARSSSAEVSNFNPDLSGLSLSVSGIALSPATAPAACARGTAVLLAEATHQVEIALGEAAREPREALQLSHFSSSGRYERQYSFVAAEQAPEVRLTWRAPAAGTALEQYLVVRDGRGGTSWLTFNACAD
jgi:hypothetical protein